MKTYEIIKYACKGVATRYAHDFIIKGMALVEKPIRLKEGLIRTQAIANIDKDSEFLKDIGANVWREVQKESHSIHIKRKGENGITWPQDAADLSDLIKNSYSEEPISIEDELHKSNIIINKPVYKDYFSDANNKKPDDWDSQKTDPPPESPLTLPNKIGSLSYLTAKGLEPGIIWFAGHPLQYHKARNGKRYLIFNFEIFKGKPTPQKFIKKIPQGLLDPYLDPQENILNKYFEIVLRKTYLGKGYPDLEVVFSDSKLSTPFEAEISDEPELSEKETEKLMGYDFGVIPLGEKNYVNRKSNT